MGRHIGETRTPPRYRPVVASASSNLSHLSASRAVIAGAHFSKMLDAGRLHVNTGDIGRDMMKCSIEVMMKVVATIAASRTASAGGGVAFYAIFQQP